MLTATMLESILTTFSGSRECVIQSKKDISLLSLAPETSSKFATSSKFQLQTISKVHYALQIPIFRDAILVCTMAAENMAGTKKG